MVAPWSFVMLAAMGASTAETDPANLGPKYLPLRAGEVRPSGWIKEQMRLDLHEGIVGNYDKISDNVNSRLFEAQNRVPGTTVTGNRGLTEKAWWAGEHEGYWKDGVVRMAFLIDDPVFKRRAAEWMAGILKAQAADGYVGIYRPENRFPGEGVKFDGELWTQSRIFQAMLAYHEFTGDADVLRAVERAVQQTLAAYRDRTYFCREDLVKCGGIPHGVGYMDTLEWLHRLTGKEVYRQGAVWLYQDYAKSRSMLADLRPDCLLDAARPWNDHTPHIMEGLHMPQIVYALTGDAQFKTAADNAILKLDRHTNPGGGVVGSEDVRGRRGGGDMPAEYCTMTEGVSSMNRILAYRGDLSMGDRVERVCLNAAQGARFHPANKAVVYLSRDNNRSAADKEHAGRYLFSASHVAAACCPLNSGRLLPYYVEGMWYRSRDGDALVANLYGACEVNTTVRGVLVRIVEETDYPFADSIHLRVEPAQPVEFSLVFRIPESAGDVELAAGAEAKIQKEKRNAVVTRRWQKGHAVRLRFGFQVQLHEQYARTERYYGWGPLVFSLKLPENVRPIEELTTVAGHKSGFFEYAIAAQDEAGWDYRIDPKARFMLVKRPGGDVLHPWAHPPMGLQGALRREDGTPVEVVLAPMGSTILRRTTFPPATAASPTGIPQKQG